MEIQNFFLLVLIGLVAGIFGGFVGFGGGIIIVPALVYIIGLPQHYAQGISLATMLPPIGILAVYNYYQHGYVNIKYAIIIAIPFMIGGYIGSKISLNIPANTLNKIFGIILLIISLKYIFGK